MRKGFVLVGGDLLVDHDEQPVSLEKYYGLETPKFD